MVDKDLKPGIPDVGKPIEKPFLVGMSGESSQGMDMSLDGNLLPKELDHLRPVDHPPANGPFSLIADDDDVGFFPPEVMLQMVLNPPRVAHPARGDNNPGSRVFVNRLRLFSGPGVDDPRNF